MVERRDSESGLRAGFVREDDVVQVPVKKDEAADKKTETEQKPQPVKEPKNKNSRAKKPTVTMRGVSGKKITGVIKVVKKAAEPQEAPEPVEETPAATAAPAAVIKTAPAEEKPAVSTPAPVVAASETQIKAQETPVQSEPAIVAEEKQPAKPEVISGRIQTADGRTISTRPPRGPQSGDYLKRQPQSTAPAEPQPARRQPEPPTVMPVPQDVAARTAMPRTGDPEKDAAARVDRRDSWRDSKPAPSRAPGGPGKDKHRTLRKRAQELSGQNVKDVLSDEVILDTFYKDSGKRGKSRRGRSGRRTAQSRQARIIAQLTHVKLPELMTVKELAEMIKKTSAEVIKKLMALGVMASLNETIDFDTATLVASEFSITTEKAVEVMEEDILFDDSEDKPQDLKERPPVVVVMGHVDHGKTSILDRIRSASVASGEAGGITQHIGAYTVNVQNKQITFLDTPGHEAFTTMRARGAQVTDIAILVVAADDGVMPQTIEAINHAKAADTQIIVAINKMDLPGANPDRIKQELSTHGLIPEEWGGSTVIVPVSAKTGQGIDELLEMILLSADLLELKANPDKQAKGTVIEAKLDKNRGSVATLLVQRGVLRTGDTLLTGSIVGRIRAMTNDRGKMVKEAGVSVPVEILGLPDVPTAGELFYVISDEKVARSLVERRRTQERQDSLKSSSRMSLETLFSQMEKGEVHDLNIIVKGDVQGSVEAVRQSLEQLTNDEVRVNVIHEAVGAINESDVRLAEVSNAIVIGFNVRPTANVAELAKEVGVDLRMYRIIYQAIEDIEAAMKGLLAPEFVENVLGHATVRQIFKVSGVGTVAGSYVTDGKITRSSQVRVLRDGKILHEGHLASLRRFKDDVREVLSGYECGIGVERFNDIKENDVIEAFVIEEKERS